MLKCLEHKKHDLYKLKLPLQLVAEHSSGDCQVRSYDVLWNCVT
jgi:hypothetical protein